MKNENIWKLLQIITSRKWLQYEPQRINKPTFGRVRQAKIQISLRIHAVWSESSLGVFWIAKDAEFLHADNEDCSDCTNAQVALSVRWAHISAGTFPHAGFQRNSLSQSQQYLKCDQRRLISACSPALHALSRSTQFAERMFIVHTFCWWLTYCLRRCRYMENALDIKRWSNMR